MCIYALNIIFILALSHQHDVSSEEFVIYAEHKYEQYDQRQYICQIRFHPVVNLESVARIGFLFEVFPAPSVSCDTEQQVYKRTQRQEYVAHKEVLHIQDRSSEHSESVPAARDCIPARTAATVLLSEPGSRCLASSRRILLSPYRSI